MGLSSFDHYSTPQNYCSPTIDRSITTRLIESSNMPLKSSFRFAHTPEWAEGLDTWSPVQILTTKTDLTRRHLDFHRDLGLYLPRHEKPRSAPISLKNLPINSKLNQNQFPPERIQLLLKRERDLLLQNDSINNQNIPIDHHHHHHSPIPITTVPTNTSRQSVSVEKPSTNEVRLPLRHSPPRMPSPPPPAPPPPQPPPPQLNQDALKTLLKEHLTSLLTRGASTINANRTFVHIPTVELRQQLRTEPKLNEERFANKTEEFISKSNQSSPLIFQQRSALGLTVIPVDLNSQRNFPSVSLEKMAQQRNPIPDSDSSSIVSNSRPATQPVPLPPPPTHLYQQQQRVVLRKNLEGTNSTNSGDILLSHESAQPLPNTRKVPLQPRSSSKNSVHRTAVPTATTTIELLPPIISGKRLHIPLANHRYL